MNSPTLRPAMNHGVPMWLVDIPAGFTGGKRQRRFFTSKELAEEYLNALSADARAFGQNWAARFASLNSRQRADLFYQLDRLERLGYPLDQLGEAVDAIARADRSPASLPLAKAIEEFLAAKSARNCRPRYLGKLRATLNMFTAGRGDTPLGEIGSNAVRDFINRNNWNGHTRKSYLSDLSSFFSFCVRQGHLLKNPARAVDVPILDDKPPGILTVPECIRLVECCQAHDPSLLPFVSLGLFAGMRPAEIARLSWDDITETAVIVEGTKAKTRSRRVIPLDQLPQLKRFLGVARTAGSPLPPKNLRERWDVLRKECGLLEGWKHDALRHSFASYHFARYHDSNLTSAILGNTPSILFRHYRALVGPAEAAKFFEIAPDSDKLNEGLLRAAAARKAKGERMLAVRDPKPSFLSS